MRVHAKTAFFSISFLVFETSGQHGYDVCKNTMQGQEYNGTVSNTVSGLTCQRWDSQTPHKHNRNDSTQFPRAATSKDENFCRNPDSEPGGPWCYTIDPGVRWEYCPVPFCDQTTLALTDDTELGGLFSTSTQSTINPSASPEANSTFILGQLNQTENETDGVTFSWQNIRPGNSFQDNGDNQSLAPSEDDVEEAAGAVYIGSVGVIMVVLFIIYLVAMDLRTYYKNFRYLYHNVQDFCHRDMTS